MCGLMYRRHAREVRDVAVGGVGWGVEVEAVGRMFSPTVVTSCFFLQTFV